MSQRIPGPGEEMLPLPDFRDDVDLFAPNITVRPHPSGVRIILTSLMLLALLAGIMVLVIRYRTHIVYQTQKATQGDLVLTFNSSGSLRTNVYTINFTGAGKLAEVDVAIGQQIKKNQILAKMDPTSLQNALNEAQANVEAGQTALDNANANYQAIQSENPSQTSYQSGASYAAAAVAHRADSISSGVDMPAAQQMITRTTDGGGPGVNTPAAQQTITRTTDGGGPGVNTPAAQQTITRTTDGGGPGVGAPATQQAVGTFPQPGTAPQAVGPSTQPITQTASKQVQLTEASGQVKAAQKGLVLAQAQLASAKYNLNNMVLKASHDGTVAAINGAVGGEPGTPFIQLTDPSILQLQANVNESHIGSVTVGDAVSFSVDAYPDQAFDGNVVAITPLSQVVAGSVTYPILANIATSVPDTVHLLSGMTAHVTTTTDQRTDVVKVPAKALTFAQSALKPSAATGNHSLVSHAQMDDALARANTLLQNLQQNTTLGQASPAVVLESDAYNNIVATPVVVGLTDGSEYEVLDGLSANDVVLVGAQTSNG